MNYFISDIHGEYDLFVELLKKIKLSSEDSLYVLGDMIDKGSDSIKVLKELHSMKNAYCILGNHEYDFLKYYRSIMRNTADNFDMVLEKMRGYFSDGEALTWELIDWLDGLPAFVKTDEFICVHAGLQLYLDGKIKDLEDASVEQLVYDRNFKNPNTLVCDKRTVFYGHTPTSYINGSVEIIKYPRGNGTGYSRIHLDTGAYLTGTMGCYCMDTDTCFYVKKPKA